MTKLLSLLCVPALLVAAPRTRHIPKSVEPLPVSTHARIETADEEHVWDLNAHINKEILVRVPPGETITKVMSGDPKRWPYSHYADKDGNPLGVSYLSVKCTTTQPSDLHIITADLSSAAHHYAFELTNDKARPADVTFILKPPAGSAPSPERFAELENAQAALLRVREERDHERDERVKAQAEAAKTEESFELFRRSYPAGIHVLYSINGSKKALRGPWYIQGMFRLDEDSRTFIRRPRNAGDLPMIETLGDDNQHVQIIAKYDPALNLYVVNQPLKRGRFVIDRHKLSFRELALPKE